jgi:site-specific recombinase XerD
MKTDIKMLSQSDAISQPLSEESRKYVNASKASNTMRAYASALNDFGLFCAKCNATPLPASSATIVEYVTALADAGQRVSTIQSKLAAITFAHNSQDSANPAQSKQVRIVMQGIRRKLGCAAQQKSPVMRNDLGKMIDALPDTLQSKRDRAILLLGFAGAFRRSEIVGLDVDDVRFGVDAMTITLRRSKTDQEGKGTTKRIPRIDDEKLCPVRALQVWLDVAQIQRGPVFRAIDRWGHARDGRLTDKAIALVIKRAATTAGLDARQFAGHSLRAGFVTQAATDRTPEWAIAEVTGHKSRAVLQRYIRDAGLGQMSAIRRAFGENDSSTDSIH